MAKGFAEIKIEGLKEFQMAARRSTDSALPKRLGQAHKQIGELVISKLQPRPEPAAVGTGAGAAVRASASKRDVLLRVGGAHRAGISSDDGKPKSPRMQWGRRPARRPGQSAPKRPYIRETIDREYDEIADAYLEAISAAMRPAFAETKP